MANILVTGGRGFLGSYVMDALKTRGHTVKTTVHTDWQSLSDSEDAWVALIEDLPDVVVHCAALVGGIGANQQRPADFLYENAMMGLNLMHHARRVGVKKFVNIGTVCMYPKYASVPFAVEDLFNGKPEESNFPYGEAKRMVMSFGQALRKQYGFNVITLIPTNLYGIGDHYDDERSHVIPALIKRYVTAVREGHETVTIWGTGTATREFLHVEDAALAIALATDLYDEDCPMNLGSGDEISISTLARMIASYAGYTGRTIFDTSKPDGQPRRRVDSDRARSVLNWWPTIQIEQGIKEMVLHYKEQGK